MDIVLVTYNSSKWICNCLKAIANSEGLEEQLNIYVVDNHSSDDTCNLIKKIDNVNGINSLSINEQPDNLGFGKANNIGAWMGAEDIICFINVDTEVFPDTFANLRKEVDSSRDDIGAWEMRQIPYEHPKLYDPLTQETSWMSGAAFAVRRSVFEQIGGFDEKIFMYAEDVDISWRIRAQGYRLKYCPKVVIKHFSYQQENEVKPMQYFGSIKNNLCLRYRYGSMKEIIIGHIMYWQTLIFAQKMFTGMKKGLFLNYIQHWKDLRHFSRNRLRKNKVAKFLGWDYELVRDGAFLENELSLESPMVSVVVRTCQRPQVLRETLISLRNQTYDNFEIVVVEDGNSSAEQMIKDEFNDLQIQYYATGEKKGRSVVGNLGLEMAKGEYINFLDDDDLFYADHIEVLIHAILKTNQLAVYSFGYETPIKIYSTDPYQYQVTDYIKRYQEDFDKIKLCHHNLMPIQCVLFSKKLYEKYGGFDTTLDYLEDWDLWVRYMQDTDYICVPKTTSIYRVPADQEKQGIRQEQLDKALQTVRNKHKSYYINISVADLVKYGEESLCQQMLKKFKFNR